MVGFNRRYVPMYRELTSLTGELFLQMEKNRTKGGAPIRRKVFDDFIHVVDTLRYLAGGEIEELTVNSIVKDDLLERIIVTYKGNDFMALGMMNRNNGITEEIVEAVSPGKKVVVEGLTKKTEYEAEEEKITTAAPWNPMLYNRGFIDIVDEFLEIVREDKDTQILAKDHLRTHQICETIVRRIKK
jgi:virulence factor